MIMTHDPDFDRHVASKRDRSDPKAATASLIWGIIAMFAWLLPPVGLLVAVAGLVRGRQGWEAPNRDRARLGVVLSVMSLLLNGWLTAWIAFVTHHPID